MRKVWDFFRYDIPQGVPNLFRWFVIIWQDRDWDQYFLLRILELKFRRMAELHENHGHLLHASRYARQLRIAELLCKRMRKSEHDFIAEGRYPLPENWKIWFEDIPDRRHSKICTTPDPWAKPRGELAASLGKQDKEMLGRLIGKYLDHWWD
jgi:hypothetical protein